MALKQSSSLLCCNRIFHSFKRQGVRQFTIFSQANVQIKNVDSDLSESSKSKKNIANKLKREYEHLCVWKDQNEIVEHLYSNIVYYEPEKDKSGLVVLNKPYGLPKSTGDDSKYSLETSLPHLADKLGLTCLSVIKSCERFTSGITILGSNQKTSEMYKKSMAKARSTKALPSSYLALVKGVPNINKLEDVDLKVTNCPEVNNPIVGSMHKEPVISRHLAKPWKIQRDNIKRVHVAAASVARASSGVGIMELTPSFVGKHFLQVYLADLGYPVIGDMMYDYRTRTLLGKKLRITSHTNAQRTQILPPHVLELLGLAKGEEWVVPKMLHHHRLLLTKWLPGGENVTVFAPPPGHWMRTCAALDLRFNYTEFAQTDKITHYQDNADRVESRRRKKEREQQVMTDLEKNIEELA